MTNGHDHHTIDELAALANLPARTIRFYQSQGTLPPPRRVGRLAYYDREHVLRLRLIASLRERGLKLEAIREVIERAQHGGESLQEWLGLTEVDKPRWTDEQPMLLDEHELVARLGETDRDGVVRAELEALGLVRRVDARAQAVYVVPSPALLDSALDLRRAGVALEASVATSELMRQHLREMAVELVAYYTAYLGEGVRGGLGDDAVRHALDTLRRVGFESLRVLFGQEVERALAELFEAQAPHADTRG